MSLKKIISTVILTLMPFAAFAEEKDSLLLYGWPKDAFTMEPVIDSTRAELMTLDSTVIATAVPHWNSHYRPNSFFTMSIGSRSGEYLIRLTNPKYQTTVTRFEIKVGKHDDPAVQTTTNPFGRCKSH